MLGGNSEKKIILIATILIIFVSIIIFLITRNNPTETKYRYDCYKLNDFDSVITINGIEYISVYFGAGDDIYDKKYEINNKYYKRDKIYALPNGETECDDNIIYTLKNISPKEYIVKIGSDHTGWYDGELYKKK